MKMVKPRKPIRVKRFETVEDVSSTRKLVIFISLLVLILLFI